MKLAFGIATALLLTIGITAAQTRDEVQITVAAFELSANGAEKPAGFSFWIDPLKTAQPGVAVFSVRDCGHFSLAVPPHSFAPNATAGWRVEVTPLRVVDRAVTFRLRWVRALDAGSTSEPTREDVEVTLKPGESRPIDAVTIARSAAKTFDGQPCTTKAVSLRISADFPSLDRRLIGADLWLVERLPGGQERIQSQSVRGPLNRAIPFYFDSVMDGAKRLDVFGNLVAYPAQGGFDISVEAVRAVPLPDEGHGYQAARWFRSTLRIRANEVVDVALPAEIEKTGPYSHFHDRAFSIRIRPKQIR